MTSLRDPRPARVALPIMPPGRGQADTAELARAAEDAGLDGISYAELLSGPLLPAYLLVLALHDREDVGDEMHALSRADRPDRWE